MTESTSISSDRPAHFPVVGQIPRTVLILGARGRLGYACVRAFAAFGWRVLAQVRPGSGLVSDVSTVKDLGRQVHWMAPQLDDRSAWQALAAACGGVDVVVNALAPKFSTSVWAKELLPLTEVGVRLARDMKALLIHPLSVLSAGKQVPAVWHECDPLPTATDTRLAPLRGATEQLLAQAAAGGVQICTLRTGTFYGQHGWGWISAAVAKDLRKGVMHWLAPYDVHTPWAYVPDVAQAMVRIAEQKLQLPGWSNLHFAGHQVTGEDWAQALEMVCHAKQWLPKSQALHRRQVRWPLWKPAGWFSPVIRALGDMEYVWRTPHRFDNSQLLSLIAQEPSTPWLRSVQQTVDVLDSRDDLHGGLLRSHEGY